MPPQSRSRSPALSRRWPDCAFILTHPAHKVIPRSPQLPRDVQSPAGYRLPRSRNGLFVPAGVTSAAGHSQPSRRTEQNPAGRGVRRPVHPADAVSPAGVTESRRPAPVLLGTRVPPDTGVSPALPCAHLLRTSRKTSRPRPTSSPVPSAPGSLASSKKRVRREAIAHVVPEHITEVRERRPRVDRQDPRGRQGAPD